MCSFLPFSSRSLLWSYLLLLLFPSPIPDPFNYSGHSPYLCNSIPPLLCSFVVYFLSHLFYSLSTISPFPSPVLSNFHLVLYFRNVGNSLGLPDAFRDVRGPHAAGGEELVACRICGLRHLSLPHNGLWSQDEADLSKGFPVSNFSSSFLVV